MCVCVCVCVCLVCKRFYNYSFCLFLYRTVKHVLSGSSTFLQALECVCTQCDSSSFITPLLKSMLENMFDSNSNISEEEEGHEQEEDETGKIILHLLDKIPLVHSTALQVVRYMLIHLYMYIHVQGFILAIAHSILLESYPP